MQDQIILCKQCGEPEFLDEIRWLSGKCSCRNCYKKQWEKENKKKYIWNDLDGERPTHVQFEKQITKKYNSQRLTKLFGKIERGNIK